METVNTRAVISAILEKTENGQSKIFVQTRWKPNVSPTYSGLLEIPAGGIEAYENVYDALKREVKEETGLDIVRIIDDYKGEIEYTRTNDSSFVFKPFICQQVLETNNGLPWIGFVFRCEVTGEINMQQSEAKDPRWISIAELEKILNETPEKVFSLQYTTLRYYAEYMKSLA
jgi:8-oxo-dGTP pyrophosphatase MutT (NUDIX family)